MRDSWVWLPDRESWIRNRFQIMSNVLPAVLMPQRARLVRCVADQIMGYFFAKSTMWTYISSSTLSETECHKNAGVCDISKVSISFLFWSFGSRKSNNALISLFKSSALGLTPLKAPYHIIDLTENPSGSSSHPWPRKHHVGDPNLLLSSSLLVYWLVHAPVIIPIRHRLIVCKLGSTPRQRVWGCSQHCFLRLTCTQKMMANLPPDLLYLR